MFFLGFSVGVILGFGVGLGLYLTKPDKYDKAAHKVAQELKEIEEELRGAFNMQGGE